MGSHHQLPLNDVKGMGGIPPPLS